MDDEEIDKCTDGFLSFIHDRGQEARELCRQLRKKLHNKKRKWRGKK